MTSPKAVQLELQFDYILTVQQSLAHQLLGRWQADEQRFLTCPSRAVFAQLLISRMPLSHGPSWLPSLIENSQHILNRLCDDSLAKFQTFCTQLSSGDGSWNSKAAE